MMHLGSIWILLLSCGSGLVPAGDARDAMTALNRVYWDASQQHFRKTPDSDSKPLDFWLTAHV